MISKVKFNNNNLKEFNFKSNMNKAEKNFTKIKILLSDLEINKSLN